MKTPLNFGLIGCGGIAYQHGEAAHLISEKVRFTACCDIKRESGEKWATRLGVEAVYTDYHQMLEKEKLDAVLIATWPNQHRKHVEDCLDVGIKNILCEKALTLTGEDALAIMTKVNECKAFLMEGFMYRHNQIISKLENLISRGDIGTVDSIHANFCSYDPEIP